MRPTIARVARFALLLPLAGAVTLVAQQPAPPALISNQEMLDGLKEDGSKWLTFGGNYANHRFSPLTQVTPENVQRLQPQWTFQTGTLGNFETTTLVRDNVLYVTGPQNVAWAVDARTGRQIWRYRRELPATGLTACCGLVNRGFAAVGDKLFMTTLDAHLLALDMKTGAVVWDATLEDYKTGYASTIAPLIVEGQGHRRRRRRRVRHPRLHRRLRCADGQAGLALLHHSGSGRARLQHLGRRLVEGRRHRRVGDRRLRSGAEPGLLRHRQPRSRLPQREPRGGQSLQLLARRARRRHRQAEVALSVHAARRARLRRRPRCRFSPT